jgi:hypothetical protein
MRQIGDKSKYFKRTLEPRVRALSDGVAGARAGILIRRGRDADADADVDAVANRSMNSGSGGNAQLKSVCRLLATLCVTCDV